jgi:hypothetical protein
VALEVGDFNNDAILDIAVTNNYGTNISVLFGHKNETFHDYTMSTIGVNPSFIVAGDFNKDMKSDVAVTNEQNHNVAILLNSCP